MKIRIGKEEYGVSNDALCDLVCRGYELKKSLDTMKEELNQINAAISEHADKYLSVSDAATLHIQTDSITCSVSVRDKVIISELPRLQILLGVQFSNLVRVREEFLPERKLIELAREDKDIAGCLDVRNYKPSITYKAG